MFLMTRPVILLVLATLIGGAGCGRSSTEGDLAFPFSRYWGYESDEFFIDLAETVEPQDLFDLTTFTDLGLEPGTDLEEASRRLGPPAEIVEIHESLTAYRFSTARGSIDVVASTSESEGHGETRWLLRTGHVSASELLDLDRLLNDLPGDASGAELVFISSKGSVALELESGMPKFLWWIRSKPRHGPKLDAIEPDSD
ncbi:MAG: hypothetical protein AAGC60_02850 [Acidobacteriota bacterium]